MIEHSPQTLASEEKATTIVIVLFIKMPMACI